MITESKWKHWLHRYLCFFGLHDWVPGNEGENCFWCYRWRRGIIPPEDVSDMLRVREQMYLHDLMHGDDVEAKDYTSDLSTSEAEGFCQRCDIVAREFFAAPFPKDE